MSAALLKKMRAMGLTMDQAIDLLEAMEAAKPDAELSPGAKRTRAWRERKASSPRDVSVTSLETRHGDVSHVGAGAPVVIPFSSSLRSEEVGVGGVGAGASVHQLDLDDWPEGKPSDHAAQLEALVASPWLDRNKSPDLVTTRGRLAVWKRDGASWEHDVVPVVTGLCANRRSRIASWKFFDDAIARSISENRATLEIPEAQARRQTGPPGGNITDRIAAEQAEARRRVLEG